MIVLGEFYRSNNRDFRVSAITCATHGARIRCLFTMEPFEQTIERECMAVGQFRCDECGEPVIVWVRPATTSEALALKFTRQAEPATFGPKETE
jgi:hypothetical protein